MERETLYSTPRVSIWPNDGSMLRLAGGAGTAVPLAHMNPGIQSKLRGTLYYKG